MYLLRGIKAVITSVFHFTKYYLATVILAVAFFVHFFLPHPEVEVLQAQQQRNQVASEIDALEKEILAVAQYPEALKKDLYSLQMKYSEADKVYLTADANNRIFGYPSRQKFLWSFGIGMIISILAIRIMYLSHGIQEKNRKRSNQVMGALGGLIGGYFFAWIFYPANDLPYAAYMTIIIGIGALASLLGYFLSRAIYIRQGELIKLRKKIDSMFDFLVEVRNRHFKKILSTALEKDLYDETYRESLKKSTKEFEKRMYDKAEELTD